MYGIYRYGVAQYPSLSATRGRVDGKDSKLCWGGCPVPYGNNNVENRLMAKQVMDMRPAKGMTTAQSNEHLRNWTDKGWDSALSRGNYDPTRERLNFEIREGEVVPMDKGRSIPERIADNLRRRGIKDPNEGLEEPIFRTVVNFLFSGSHERMNELAFGNQTVCLEKDADNSHIERQKDIEEWAKDVYSFVGDKYGEENIAAFIVHLDETTAHIHCTLLPIRDGKFAYKRIFAGKDKYEFSARMKKLHSEFAEVNAKWGMERGSAVSETGAKHRTTEEYRRRLSEQCTTFERTIDAQQRILASLQAEIRLAERRVKGLTSMVKNLKERRAVKEAMLADLQRQIANVENAPETIKEQVRELERELADIQTKLDDKLDKLDDADRKLEELKDEMTATRERTEELRNESLHYTGTIQRGVNTLMKDVLLESMVNDYVHRTARFPPETEKLFDGSLLQSFADSGTEVLHCAMLLFLGFVDDATTFAEGHGGGGTSNDMKWGRDDDEDDRMWARRCMMTASRMMRPSSGKKPKR